MNPQKQGNKHPPLFSYRSKIMASISVGDSVGDGGIVFVGNGVWVGGTVVGVKVGVIVAVQSCCSASSVNPSDPV